MDNESKIAKSFLRSLWEYRAEQEGGYDLKFQPQKTTMREPFPAPGLNISRDTGTTFRPKTKEREMLFRIVAKEPGP